MRWYLIMAIFWTILALFAANILNFAIAFGMMVLSLYWDMTSRREAKKRTCTHQHLVEDKLGILHCAICGSYDVT